MQCLLSTKFDDFFQKSVEQGWNPIIRMGSESNLEERSKDPNPLKIILAGRVEGPDPHYFGKLDPDHLQH
jgi:hypothetical protein